MNQPARAPRPVVDDTDIKVRNRRMLIVGGVMAMLAFVVAAGFWYTNQPGQAAPPPSELSITSADGDLVVGLADAAHQVVIEESFQCASCARFERSAQAFLAADAAAGLVQIRYVIPAGSNSEYDQALATEPADALALHDRLFASGAAQGTFALKVSVDGRPLDTTDPLELSMALESALAQ